MYTAIILVCLAASPEKCFELQDTWGPHATVESCKERADQMKEESLVIFERNGLPFIVEAWRCDDKGTV